MIPVSSNFSAKRRSGVTRYDPLVELYLPTNPSSVQVTGAAANFPGSAIIDGDRTHLNAGPLTGLYPPPAGPENFIGFGMWKSAVIASGGTPQRIILLTGGARVGRIRISTHPSEGGIKVFRVKTADTFPGPEVTVTSYRRVRAWEQSNFRSTVVVAGGGDVTVTPVNTNRLSIPSVIELVLTTNFTGTAAAAVIVEVTDAGPFATAAGDGFARACEVELFRVEDVTAQASDLDVVLGTDVRLRTVNAREGKITLKNALNLFAPSDFQRGTSGQVSVGSVPECAGFVGIDNEYVQVGYFAVDQASFKHPTRDLDLTLRGRTEQPLFDRPVGTYREFIELDAACDLEWTLVNNQQGTSSVERNSTIMPRFMPQDEARSELEQLRQAAQDRGVYVNHEGILSSLTGTTVSIPKMAFSVVGTNTWQLAFTRGISNDNLFFDPGSNPLRLIFPDRTFQTFKSGGGLNDTDCDRISAWDMRQAFSTKTLVQRIFNGAETPRAPVTANDLKSVPYAGARRPGTNDWYFFVSGVYIGDDPSFSPPFLLSAYTILNGVATPILVNQVIPAFVASATFIGNVLYWWEATHNNAVGFNFDGEANTNVAGPPFRNHTLVKWDVTTPFARTVIGLAFRPGGGAGGPRSIRSMIAVGTFLFWAQNDDFTAGFTPNPPTDANLWRWDTTTAFDFVNPNSFINFGTMMPMRLLSDGVAVWGAGQRGGDPGSGFNVGGVVFKITAPTGAFSTAYAEDPPVGADDRFRSGGAIALFGTGVLFAAREGGRIVLRRWDGVNDSGAPVVAFGSKASVRPPYAMAISTATWYGKRVVVVVEQDTLNLHVFLYKDETVSVETLGAGGLVELNENVAYELGGASAQTVAIDITVHTILNTPGHVLVYTESAASVNENPHFAVLDSTSRPPFLVPTGGVVVTRQHARVPLITSTAPGTVTGFLMTDSPAVIRITRSDVGNPDPNLLNAESLDSRWLTDIGQAYNLGNSILSETRSGVRWLTVTVPLFPEIELGDVVSLNVTQRTNATPLTITGNYRVVHINHRISAGSGDAELRTVLELVSV